MNILMREITLPVILLFNRILRKEEIVNTITFNMEATNLAQLFSDSNIAMQLRIKVSILFYLYSLEFKFYITISFYCPVQLQISYPNCALLGQYKVIYFLCRPPQSMCSKWLKFSTHALFVTYYGTSKSQALRLKQPLIITTNQNVIYQTYRQLKNIFCLIIYYIFIGSSSFSPCN